MATKFLARVKRLAAGAVAVCVTAALAATAFAATANEAVQDDTSGVVQVKVVYKDETGNYHPVQSGTGFLINDSTVITCEHVVSVDDATLEMAALAFGTDAKTALDRMSVQISVLRDVAISATVLNSSTEMDFAILRLNNQQLYDRHYLSLRESSTVVPTESVYALGFPGEAEYLQDVNTYTSEDVTISAGQVNKLNTVNGVDFVQHSGKTTSGASGGPLVDENGAVVGIIKGSSGDGMDANYYYAIAIDQLIKTLDALGIEYTKAGETAPVTEPESGAESQPEASSVPAEADKSALNAAIDAAKAIDLSGYEETGAAAFEEALAQAQSVQSDLAATQAQVDQAAQALAQAQLALEEKGGIPMTFVVVGIVALVAVIVVIVIVVVAGGKKNKIDAQPAVPAQGRAPEPPASAGGFQTVDKFQPSATQPPYVPPKAGETTLLNQGAGETTLLNQGAGETTLLSQNQNMGSLLRTRSGETIRISKDNFLIGKERSKVTYCISDNTSISRTHARITFRAGKAYLEDLKATNGTYLNGTPVSGAAQELKDGDKITLADEDFIYHKN